jgi:hypothetical protein
LPFLFIAFGIPYLLTDLCVVSASWLISDWLIGPQIGVYKGYQRTWYGIDLHLVLWFGLFVMLSRVPMKLRSLSQAIDHR